MNLTTFQSLFFPFHYSLFTEKLKVSEGGNGAMTRITESAIEKFAIELLEKQGWRYVYGPDIAPNEAKQERAGFGEDFEKGVFTNDTDRGVRDD